MKLFEVLLKIMAAFLQGFRIFLEPVILIPGGIIAIIATIILIIKNREYKQGAYYQVTRHPFLSVYYNPGRYGEYLTYKYLKHMESEGARFLFNIYVPKENGETSEIDVLMICSKGIFVFESKNYSGWIFGSEGQKNWYQTLPTGRGRGRSHKEHFYNPVMQNQSHIKHLTAFLNEQLPLRSVIVFSDRCTLKNVQIKSRDVKVIKRYHVASVVADIYKQTAADLLSDPKVTEIYYKLYPLTQVSKDTKDQHIRNIQQSTGKKAVSRAQTSKEPPADKNAASQPQLSAKTVSSDNEAIVSNSVTAKTILANGILPDTASLICPRCHSPLVLRTASKGANAGNKFYGCSNYPKCRYIQSIVDK